MIDESLAKLISTLERCAAALEAISGRVSEAKAVKNLSVTAPAPVEPPATPTPPPTNGAAVTEPDAPVAYETLRLAVVELAKVKGHKLAMSMLEEFGVTTGKDLPPAQYSKALKRAKELLK